MNDTAPDIKLPYGQIMRSCGTCANWMQLDQAPHAGWCRLASGIKPNMGGVNERYGLMTTDLQVCSQWMGNGR